MNSVILRAFCQNLVKLGQKGVILAKNRHFYPFFRRVLRVLRGPIYVPALLWMLFYASVMAKPLDDTTISFSSVSTQAGTTIGETAGTTIALTSAKITTQKQNEENYGTLYRQDRWAIGLVMLTEIV